MAVTQPSNWDKITDDDKYMYFANNCNCADKIVVDVCDYLLSIPHFKQADNIMMCKYELRSKSSFTSKGHIYTMLITIMKELDALEGRERYSTTNQSILNDEFHNASYKEQRRILKNAWFISENNSGNKYTDNLIYYWIKKREENIGLHECSCGFDELIRNTIYDNVTEDYIEIEEVRIATCMIYCLEYNRAARCAFVTALFDLMIDPTILPYMNLFMKTNNRFKTTMKKRFKHIKDYEHIIVNSYWRGTDYYYKKLFNNSIYISELDIPNEVIELRINSNFNDMIYGHPLASHGLFQESMDEIDCLVKEYYS